MKNKNKNHQRFQFDKQLKKYTFQDDDDDDSDSGKSGVAADVIDPAQKLQNQMANLKQKQSSAQAFKIDYNLVDTPSLVMEGAVELSTDYSNLEATKECEIKQGYLAIVTDISRSKYINENGTTIIGNNPIITAKAMFAVLNKQSLSFFDKEHVNSLYKVLDIVHLKPAYYPSAFGDLNCFQLVGVNQVKMNLVSIIRKVQYLPLAKTMATLCAVNKETMEEWADAISTFHNCNVEVAKNDVVEQTTSIDVLKEKKEVLKRRLNDQLKLSDSEAKDDDSNEVIAIQKMLDDIKAQILAEKVKQSQEKRVETIKLEQDIKMAQETQQVQDCIQKVMAIQQEEEENQVEQMITKESETKEELTLQEKKRKIIELLKKQGVNQKEAQMSIEETIEKMTSDMKYNMVQTVQQYSKVLDPTMCYFAEYGFPSEIKSKADRYKYVCTRMIDVSELDIENINNCLIPSYFCDVCCEYNIGAAKQQEREQCSDKCTNKANVGAPNKFILSYTIVPNNLKIAQLNILIQQQDIAQQNKDILKAQQAAQKAPLKPLPPLANPNVQPPSSPNAKPGVAVPPTAAPVGPK